MNSLSLPRLCGAKASFLLEIRANHWNQIVLPREAKREPISPLEGVWQLAAPNQPKNSGRGRNIVKEQEKTGNNLRYVKLIKMVFHIFHNAIVDKFSPFFKKSARPAVDPVENSVENVKYLRGQ